MNERILVVDDEQQVRDLLQVYFRRRDFVVSLASSSAETLTRIEEQKPDVIILDIGLGQEDGLKVLSLIKSLHPDIKVIMLTGMGFVEDLLSEAQQKGADGYVSKVLPLDELLSEVNRVLRCVHA